MSSSLLYHYSTPAERFRGCRCAYGFETADLVQRNGGTIVGAPTINFGATFDGTNDRIEYNLSGEELNRENFSAVIRFTPAFAPTDDIAVHWFDTDDNRFSLFKRNNAGDNDLRLILGGTTVGDIAYATYSPHWNALAKNTFVIYATSGASYVALNGVVIMDSDPTAWSPSATETTLTVASQNGGGNQFSGVIHWFKTFNQVLTRAEAEDYCDDSTYTYRNNSICHLPMTMETHDPANNRTLDVSGNGFHFDLGDGAGSDAPTKKTTRGYRFAGSQYLRRARFFDENADFTVAILVKKDLLSDTEYVWCARDAAGDGIYVFFLGGGAAIWQNYNSTVTRPDKYSPGVAESAISVIDVDGDQYSYMDGTLKDSDDISGETIDVTDPYFYIGARNTGGARLTGSVYQFQVWDRLLTPMQVADWHIRALKQVNHV